MKYSDMPMGKAFIIALDGEMDDTGDKAWDMPVVDNPEIELAPAEAKYVQAMLDIVSEFGKLSDNDGNGIWVGYESPEENEDAEMGVKCANCAFYCTVETGKCHIVAQTVQPEGMCRLAAIGVGLVGESKDED